MASTRRKTISRTANANVRSLSKRGDHLAEFAVDALDNANTGSTSLISLGTPAAGAAVHAAVAGNAVANLFPGPITQPSVPRNLSFVFAASYDGGNITVVGTDQFDQPQTEVITAVASSTVPGVRIFKTVTSITKAAVGANPATVTVNSGVKLGITVVPVNDVVLGAVNGVFEAVTFDLANRAVTYTTAPNGSRVLTLLVNI